MPPSIPHAGRATGVTGAKSGEANKTYASAIGYAPHGALASLTMGNSMVETWNYNSRLQPRQVSAARSGTTHLQLGLYYCGTQSHACGDNNGNPRIETIAIPGQAWTRSFGYDGWNRVSTAGEGADSRNFGYSATGNMWVTASSAGWTPPSFTPRTSAWFDANNRLVNAGLGVQYDTAGNQTAIGSYAFTYDAEGRMTASTIAGSATAYSYDGEGRRVKKTAAGVSTVYVYGADGQLMAEYGGPAQAAGTRYVTTDHLGSTRLVTDASGSVVSRHDYLPFGEEIPAGVGGRTTAMGYVANPAVTQKFTGKERDGETGLDYFGARYLSGVQGRFTSPDPIFIHPDRLVNPQRLNLYMYARNNPLVYIDPNGLDDISYDQSGKEIARVKKGKWHNFWHGDTYKLKADDGKTYTLDAALKPLGDGQRYSLISAADTASLISSFASNHSGDSGVQGTPADVMANSPEGKPWDLKNSSHFARQGYSTRSSLFLLGDGGAYRADYVGNVAWAMIMASHGWGEMTAHAGAGSQSLFANIMRGRMYSPMTLFDDPRDYEAIRRGYGMFGASGRAPFHWLTNSIYQVARKDPTGCVLVGACR